LPSVADACTLALADRGGGHATELSGRLVNERVGAALHAFAQSTFAVKSSLDLDKWCWFDREH
jgi:hypothetical protein